MRALFTGLWILLIFAVLTWSRWIHFDTSKTLNVFTWGGVFVPEIVKEFEKETGAKVSLSYFTSNEELLTKLKKSNGKGYDIIVASDYAIKLLMKESFLAPLEKNRLSFFSDLNPVLLYHTFDLRNTYSIPFQWGIYGLAYDESVFQTPPSWNALFTESDYSVGMTSDATEAFTMASFYLFGPVDHLSSDQASAVARLLAKQRPWVEAYGLRGDYLVATHNCPLAMSTTPTYFPTARFFPSMRFSIPKGWAMVSIESLTLAASSTKQDLAYDFINYMYTPKNQALMADEFFFFPATMSSIKHIQLSQEFFDILHTVSEGAWQFHFFSHLIPEPEIRSIWIETKS